MKKRSQPPKREKPESIDKLFAEFLEREGQMMLETAFIVEALEVFLEGLDVKIMEECGRDVGKDVIGQHIAMHLIGENRDNPYFMSTVLSLVLSSLPPSRYMVSPLPSSAIDDLFDVMDDMEAEDEEDEVDEEDGELYPVLLVYHQPEMRDGNYVCHVRLSNDQIGLPGMPTEKILIADTLEDLHKKMQHYAPGVEKYDPEIMPSGVVEVWR